MHCNRGGCQQRNRRRQGQRTRVAMDVQALLVISVTTEARRVPAITVEAHHVIAGLIVALRIEASRIVTRRIKAEGVVAVHIVASGIVAVVVETGAVESEDVVAVDVEAGRVVDILRGTRLTTLLDVSDRESLVGPPGLHSAIRNTVERVAVKLGLENETLHSGEVRAKVDGLTARQLVVAALEGLDTEDALHSAVGRREEAVEVYGEIESGEHESLFSCERRSSDESHLLLG